MLAKDFTKLVDKNLNKIKNVLCKKTAEYNLDDDRLSVFKRAGELERCTPEQALFGFVSKQIISISDYIIEENYDKEKYYEKCIDIIAYMLLLLALVEEHTEDNK